jgi:hypothetical protein
MWITLHQTGSNDDLGESVCATCEQRFYLGAVSSSAITERRGMLLGQVCLACLAAGSEYIEKSLDNKALWCKLASEEASEIAEEGVSDVPTLDEVLAAEAYYERPMFETWEEYDEAVGRGEIDL